MLCSYRNADVVRNAHADLKKKSLRNVESSTIAVALKVSEGKTIPVVLPLAIHVTRTNILQEQQKRLTEFATLFHGKRSDRLVFEPRAFLVSLEERCIKIAAV